jgi:hypothetical protein
MPAPVCDTTPWPSADTFTRHTAALLCTEKVPSRSQSWTRHRPHHSLQDRNFHYLKRRDTPSVTKKSRLAFFVSLAVKDGELSEHLIDSVESTHR